MGNMKKSNRRIIEILFLVAGAVLVVVLLRTCIVNTEFEDSVPPQDSVVAEPRIMYGISVDSMVVQTEKVQKNESLAQILTRYNVDYGAVDYLARNTRDTFDVRKIRPGKKFSLLRMGDSAQSVRYFVYEITARDYVVWQLKDSLKAWRGQKSVVKRLSSIQGDIHSSLWNAILESGGNPNLAVSFSDIYAWTIDFFGIQKGDYFSAVYEELLVDDEVIGLGAVLSSRFHHAGNDYYAFYYDNGTNADYYDELGGSMRRTFLKAPLQFRRISSKFTHSRMHPVLKIRRPHHGIDYAAAEGTPVYTIGDGVVIARGYDRKGGGNYVKVKHNGTYTTVYMHLKGFARGLKTGMHLKQGQLLGYVGKTGLATGPHLDFRVYKNGTPIDPLAVKSPPAHPVDSLHKDRFMNFVQQQLVQLDSLRGSAALAVE